MNENFDGNPGPDRKCDQNGQRNGFDPTANQRPFSPGQTQVNGHSRAPVFNFWVAADLLAHRWGWIALGALLCAGGFFLLGSRMIKPKFTASAQLLRYESPAAKDFFQSTPMTVETFAGLIRSPDLLTKVGNSVNPPIPPEKLTKRIKIDPQSDSDIVKVLLAADDPKEAVDLLDVYLREVGVFTKEYQKQLAASVANTYWKKQLEKMDDDIGTLQKTFRGISASPQVTNKLNEIGTNLSAALNSSGSTASRMSPLVAFHAERLNKALIELAGLTANLTDMHPSVRMKRQEIEAIKASAKEAETNNTGVSYLVPSEVARSSANAFNPELDIIRTKLLSVEEERVKLANRRTQAELFATDPPGMVQVLSPPSLKAVQTNMRELKISIVSVFGGFLGIGLSLLLLMLVELTDKRLRTAADVERVTGLPLLSSLGDLKKMSEQSRARWAFRTWTMLQGKLSRSANHGLVCGITSCAEGEGRSTWIHMLAEAASLTGFRVLTIATKPSSSNAMEDEKEPQALQMPDQLVTESMEQQAAGPVSTNVLASPAKVTEQLTGTQSQPVVHIPLPGWVWNLERRKQWREALNHWRRIDNLVILVELPPASVAEAVLLGSNLPNLLWLAESGAADAAETRAQLETLRHARCNLVGAVLNREGETSLKQRFPRWLGCFLLLVASSGALTSQAAQAGVADSTTKDDKVPVHSLAAAGNSENRSFSIVNPSQRAAWQQHLTLGPGDVLTLALYGQPELTRSEVAIAPDGMINYLEATNVLATGLTIDELRTKLDEGLGQYRRAPRTMITPIAFKSKKYYMLGKVLAKGVYTLDRPLTVIEAIARARGFENGLVDRNIIDLADYQRSFVMRDGKRIPLNFEKLFQEGDLTQNIAIEPGDYVYFPSTNVKEVYVVGEVRLPGTVTFTPDLTIIGAIAARAGYTERAYKARVLVVRGSINHPELLAVDTHAILDARGTDFKLQPKDIVYVNSRPFIRVEELADLAATAFIQSLITSVVGVHVVKPIQ
jgi:protein involved in polysaccharide export with SLBB domain/capsular polysaccharide biosynthesis protein